MKEKLVHTRLKKAITPLFVVILFGLILLSPQAQINGQQLTDSTRSIPYYNYPLVYGSDTLPAIILPGVNIYDANKYNYLQSRKYRRLIRNVKKAYPYAIIANNRLKALDRKLASMDSKRDRKEYMKEAEKEIMEEFEDELKKLTITQGIILVKLIDRETGQTSYEVLKDIKGGFTAFFWQGVARLFGNDLKLQYDPDGEDKTVEDIIMAIEYGFI